MKDDSLDLRDPAFYRRDPQDTWARLREADGLVRDRNGFVAIARFADVLAAERNAADLSSARGYRVHWEPLEVVATRAEAAFEQPLVAGVAIGLALIDPVGLGNLARTVSAVDEGHEAAAECSGEDSAGGAV